jgi:acyl carrier protein
MPLPAEVPQNKRLKIRINGANYISDETKAAFSEALAEKNWLGLSEKTTSPSPALPIPCTPDPLPTSYSLRSEHQTVVETIMNTPEKETAFSLSQPSSGLIFGSSLESVLKLFLEHQSEVLHVHEKYLKIHAESPQSFLQMLQELYRLLGNGNSQTQFPLPREEKIVESQPEVAKIESDRSGANLEQSWFQALAESRSEEQNCVRTTTFSFSEANSPAVEQPSFAVRESDPPQEEIIYSEAVKTNLCTLPSSTDSPVTKALLEIVCKNTGYPAEMLEVEMDLEADLGVDSIKRVEIMGAMQELFPDLPKLSPDELGEQRSIADIAQYLSMQLIEAEKKIAV